MKKLAFVCFFSEEVFCLLIFNQIKLIANPSLDFLLMLPWGFNISI